MDSTKNLLLQDRAKAKNDDDFINRIEKLVQDKGSIICQSLFSLLANLNLEKSVAEKYWQEVVAHRQDLQQSLNRDISLLMAIGDYLDLHHQLPNTLKLIDIQTYDNVLNKTIHDDLTGLFNRPYFDEILSQHMSQARRYNSDFSILFLDIDDFKIINDSLGHQTGDHALQKLAEIINNEKRDSDIAARYGGEEFVILMPKTSSLKALILGERIRKQIAKMVLTADKQDFQLTVSGGIASFPVNGQDQKALMNVADRALYMAKGAGKNTISLFKEDKRRFLRMKYHKPVQVKELGFNDKFQPSKGMSKDICVGGILFKSTKQFNIGSRIQLSIPIKDEEPLLLIGTVVRVEIYGLENYDIGMTISFKELDKIASNEISTFLFEQLQSDKTN